MDPNELLVHECDVLIPCALGGVLNRFVPRLATFFLFLISTLNQMHYLIQENYSMKCMRETLYRLLLSFRVFKVL